MRLRAAVVAAVFLTALTMAPAGAGKGAKTRRVIVPYELTDRNHGVAAGGNEAGAYYGEDAYAVELQRGENAVSVMVLDNQEGDVSAVIAQWVTDGSAGGASYGHAATYHEICTKTAAPCASCRARSSRSCSRRGRARTGRRRLPPTAISSWTSTGRGRDARPSLPCRWRGVVPSRYCGQAGGSRCGCGRQWL